MILSYTHLGSDVLKRGRLFVEYGKICSKIARMDI